MIAEFGKKSDVTEFNLTDIVIFKSTIISEVLSTIKDKLHILTGRIKKMSCRQDPIHQNLHLMKMQSYLEGGNLNREG